MENTQALTILINSPVLRININFHKKNTINHDNQTRLIGLPFLNTGYFGGSKDSLHLLWTTILFKVHCMLRIELFSTAAHLNSLPSLSVLQISVIASAVSREQMRKLTASLEAQLKPPKEMHLFMRRWRRIILNSMWLGNENIQTSQH